MVGLSNVDNISDINKPISTATQTALNLKSDATTTTSNYNTLVSAINLKSDKTNVTSNYNTLNSAILLKSNSTDVYNKIDTYSKTQSDATLTSNNTTSNNAIALKAPLNNPTFTGNVTGISKSMVGLSNVDNISDINKPISTATQSALNL